MSYDILYMLTYGITGCITGCISYIICMVNYNIKTKLYNNHRLLNGNINQY